MIEIPKEVFDPDKFNYLLLKAKAWQEIFKDTYGEYPEGYKEEDK